MKLYCKNSIISYLNPRLVDAVYNGAVLGDLQINDKLDYSPLAFSNLRLDGQNEQLGRKGVMELQQNDLVCKLLKPDANTKVIVQPLIIPKSPLSDAFNFRMGEEGCANCPLAQILCGKSILSVDGLKFYREIVPGTEIALDQQTAVLTWLDILKSSR